MPYYIDQDNRFQSVDEEYYDKWRNYFDIDSILPKFEVLIDD